MRIHVRVALLLVGLVQVTACTVARSETLENAMQHVARELASRLAKDGVERISVEINAPVTDAATRRIREVFVRAIDECENVDVTNVAPQMKVVLRYSRSDDTNRYSADATVFDRRNSSLVRFPTNFELDPIDRATVEGPNFDASEGGSRPATKRRTIAGLNALPNPIVSATASGVASDLRPTFASRFHVEILAAPRVADGPAPPASFSARPITVIDGMPFVDLEEGDVYKVRIRNDAPHAVAVDLAIDGVNMFALSGEERWKELGKFFVESEGSCEIVGYHLRRNRDESGRVLDDTYGEFTVVDVPSSLATEQGRDPGGIGQISAQFYAAWGPDEERPNVEPISYNSVGTKPGAVMDRRTSEVTVYTGTSLLAAITVRYERPTRAVSREGN